MGFADSIKVNSDKILESINKKCYSIFWQLSTSIVYRTPVLKGQLINNWYPSMGNFSSESSTSLSLSGSDSLSRINSLANNKEFYNKDGMMTLTNNLSYSVLAEYIGWLPPQWSGRVKPYRMVALSLIDVAARNR